MENLTITLSGEGLQDTQALNIQVSVAAEINTSAKTAQHKATTWLISEVGNMLIGGTPQLIISVYVLHRRPPIYKWSSPMALRDPEHGVCLC
jgi:hypothetical protein